MTEPPPPRFVIYGHTGSVRWQHGQIIVSGVDGGRLCAPVEAVSVRLVDSPRGEDVELNLLAEFGGPGRPTEPWRARTFARVLVRFPASCRVRLQGFLESVRIEQAGLRMNAPAPAPAPLDEGYPMLPVGRGAPEPAATRDEWVVFQPLLDLTGVVPDSGRKRSP